MYRDVCRSQGIPTYIGHTYVGHTYIGHTYIGHDYTGHNYIPSWRHKEDVFATIGQYPGNLYLDNLVRQPSQTIAIMNLIVSDMQ